MPVPNPKKVPLPSERTADKGNISTSYGISPGNSGALHISEVGEHCFFKLPSPELPTARGGWAVSGAEI